MTSRFFDLQSGAGPNRFRLDVTDNLCVGPPGNVFLFGGAGLAAGVTAAERVTGRNLVWASAQFLSYVRIGQSLDLDVAVVQAGRNISQVRVTASADDTTILTVNAALGDRPDQPADRWTPAPAMPAPDECEPWELWPRQGASMNARLDVRMVPGRFGAVPRDGTRSDDGRMVMWMRSIDDVAIDAAMLAIFADFVPSGVAAALGRPGGGNSLDNTLRVLRVVPTRWVLCDVAIQAIDRGFAHGDMRLFAETGELMAIASQSMILRFMNE